MSKTKQQLANTTLALKLWHERVNPEDVVPKLDAWVCGTQACFGGHLATWPEFQAMGVSPAYRTGAPIMTSTHSTTDVSQHLFGSYWMFESVRLHEFGAAPYDVVVDRLETQRSALQHSLLSHAGYLLRVRDPAVKVGFPGAYMLCSADDGADGYCIVGDVCRNLVAEAYEAYEAYEAIFHE